VDKEISELTEQRNSLIAHWNLEKNLIKTIRSSKEEIENLKAEADREEREGNLAKVAEIRYGKLIELQKLIDAKTAELAELQKTNKMLKEEVDAEDIAEIVSKWTGIPVNTNA
jgi:ATP-dependent Clp protease ATP-binding subunit ClpB